MPSTGFHSFLHYAQQYQSMMGSCVNALNGLPFISTSKRYNRICYSDNVSMPSTGFHSFLHRLMKHLIMKVTVSMPSTGFHSFLHPGRKEKERLTMCVNALNGLPFISTEIEMIKDPEIRKCQCPQRASIHFYGSLETYPR